MTIYHDAYLLELRELANKLKPYIELLAQENNGYQALRATTLELFDTNNQVKRLAAEYGGWIKDQVAELTTSSSASNVAFLLIHVLYQQIIDPENSKGGLGHHEEGIRNTLETLGWAREEISLLIYGNDFGTFGREWLDSNDDFWTYFEPASQAGHAGWLSLDNINSLFDKLQESEAELANLLSRTNLNPYEATNPIAIAKQMLSRAKESNYDLCIIISG